MTSFSSSRQTQTGLVAAKSAECIESPIDGADAALESWRNHARTHEPCTPNLKGLPKPELRIEPNNRSQVTAPTAAPVPAAVRRWEMSVVATLNSLIDRSSRCARGIGYNDEVSLLVSLPPDLRPWNASPGDDEQGALELVCVKWTDVAKREGRQVRIDPQNRVVFAPSHMFGTAVPSQTFPLDSFADLLHASGAQSRRYKNQFRVHPLWFACLLLPDCSAAMATACLDSDLKTFLLRAKRCANLRMLTECAHVSNTLYIYIVCNLHTHVCVCVFVCVIHVL